MRLFLLLGLLVSLSASAKTESFSGSMSCRITGQVALRSVDGKATRYGSVEGYKDGAKVDFQYSIGEDLYDENGFELVLKLKPDGADSPDVDKTIYDEDLSLVSKTSFYSQKDGFNELTSESLDISDKLSTLALKRYYKNDWHGLFTSMVGTFVHAYTLDCRTRIDNWGSVLEVMTKVARERMDCEASRPCIQKKKTFGRN